MNKQKLKNLFKIGTLIFGISFLLTNCEKNNVSEKEILEVTPELEQHDISITLTSFSQPEEKLSGLRNKYHIDSHIGIKQSAKTQSKSSNGKSNIIIYTDIVKKITQGDYTSYTMLIESLDDDPNTFYNITIEEKNDATGMFVTQYKSIPQNKSAKNTLSKSSTSSETQISTKTITTIQEPLGKEDFGNEEGGSSGGGSGGGGSSSTYPTDCDGLVNTTTVAVETPCGCGHSWNQLLNGTCIGCSTGYPTWPSLETNTIYECIPSSIGNPTTGGGTDTGGGGVSVPPNDINDDSITTPVNPDGSSWVSEEAIQFLLDNPQYNLSQILNWFSKDYPDVEPIDLRINPANITYDSPVIQTDLPSFDDMLTNFPKYGTAGNYTQMGTQAAYELAGGSLLQSRNANPKSYSNACSIRGSRGLLYSGIDIPVIKNTNDSQRTQKGGDGNNYILDAVTFNKFMNDKFGAPTHTLTGTDALNKAKIAKMLDGKNGIYVIVNNSHAKAGYSGHVDMIINGECIGGAYTDVDGGAKSISVWTLE